MRWAAIEPVAHYHGGEPIKPTYTRVARRGGKMIGRAAARKLLTLVYYGLRDGEVRCLAERAAWGRAGHSKGLSSTNDVAPHS